MELTDDIKKKITEELNSIKDSMYNTEDYHYRQELGQFFTPPNLVIKLIEHLSTLDDDIVDPCAGSGNLLIGCVIAGADPERCYGIELDPEQAELCRGFLEKYGVPRSHIITGDCLDNTVWEQLGRLGCK